jgi:general secretion pathway protein K
MSGLWPSVNSPMVVQARGPGVVARRIVRRGQRGVALAIVVWFIAGMSLLVAGIVSHARVDTRMAQLHVARAKAAAAGDGAIQLMMAQLSTGQAASSAQGGSPEQSFRLGSLVVRVNVVPTSALIDLNSASEALLAALFVVAAGLDQGEAQTVAGNVVKWRLTNKGSNTRAAFAAVEDLLRVEGVSRTLLDAIKDYIVAGPGAQRGINWSLAPDKVLAVIKKIDPQKADAALRNRASLAQAASQPEDAARATGSVTALSGPLRLDAIVLYGDKTWLRRRWVSMRGTTSSLLPWRILRTEAPRVVGARGAN